MFKMYEDLLAKPKPMWLKVDHFKKPFSKSLAKRADILLPPQ